MIIFASAILFIIKRLWISHTYKVLNDKPKYMFIESLTSPPVLLEVILSPVFFLVLHQIKIKSSFFVKLILPLAISLGLSRNSMAIFQSQHNLNRQGTPIKDNLWWHLYFMNIQIHRMYKYKSYKYNVLYCIRKKSRKGLLKTETFIGCSRWQ